MSKYDVLGIGNSIVDVLSFIDEDFLQNHDIEKGVMTLVDEVRAEELYQAMGQTTEVSGGSAANTVSGIASLGGKPAFIGRVKDDVLGEIFSHDLNGVGVDFNSPRAKKGKPTASCLVLVTPDAERTMMTFLGACTELTEDYIDEDLIKNSQVIYIEGYLWDGDAKAAIRKAISIAKDNNVKVAFTLSDPFCVSRHKDEFLELLQDIDILFANEDEAKMLFDGEINAPCEIVAVTKGENGSVIHANNEQISIQKSEISNLVDTTGAGDLYAAGFLYGYTQGKDLADCGKLGSFAAGQIIQQLGARPQKPLKELAA